MLKTGDEYRDFYVIDVCDVKDFKSKGIYLRHKTTGLEVFHLLNDDDENLFSFCFRTPVSDSKGTPHVIEHSVLCGSEKFKLKEPFITLKSKSVLTFLNALTYPDKTLYPGASQIEKQYFDIMDVYADAVFFPILSEITFNQEAHRMELDENGELSVQGVVYNEMKGVYSDFYSVVLRNINKSLFPKTTYENSSGGDPVEICKLTYKEFLNFHHKYYSPENCLLYLYGNIPTEKQLDFIAEKYIPRLQKKFNLFAELKDYKVPLPKIYDEIKQLETFDVKNAKSINRYFAPKSGMEGSVVSVCFYADQPDMEQFLLFSVLCGSDSAPLKRRLKDSKIGTDCWTMLSAHADRNVFSFNLIGVEKEDEEKVKNIVVSAIEEIYNVGISQDDIDSTVMSIDFCLREIKRSGGPYSLNLLNKVLDAWNFAHHPAEKLSPISEFRKVKEKLNNDKDFLRSLMKKYFIGKPYVFTVIEPSDDFMKKRNEIEAEFIDNQKKIINIENLKKELASLHEYQNSADSPEAQASIPHLKISELPANLEKMEVSVEKNKNDIFLFTDEVNTNGIVYFKVLFPCDVLKPEYYLDLPLFSDTLLDLGWGGKHWSTCLKQADKIFGDSNVSVASFALAESLVAEENSKKYKNERLFNRDWVAFNIKFIAEKTKDALNLLAEILNGLDFKDSERLESLITEIITDIKPSLVSNGLDFCLKRASYSFSRLNVIEEILFGFTQFKYMLGCKPKDSKKLLEKFKIMFEQIKNAGCIINITADEESLEATKKYLPEFIDSAKLTSLVSEQKYKKEDYIHLVYSPAENSLDVIKTETQVGYAVSVFKTVELFSKKGAAIELLTSWLSEHSFWEKLRTVHGCYGAEADYDEILNLVWFSTYRDPNPKDSFELFKQCIEEVRQNKLSNEEMECAIVSIYSNYVKPIAPGVHGVKALRRMFAGVSQDIVNEYVKGLLSLSADDIVEAADLIAESCRKDKKAMLCSSESEITGNILEF